MQGERSLRGIAGAAARADVAMDRATQGANRLRDTVAGLALGAAFVTGVNVIADFAQAMSTVQAITGATGAQFEQLRATAQALGATTRFSATQAADGMAFLARAGFDTNEVLDSIEGTLQLAQAGGLDLAAAADIASNVLSGFNLEASDAGRIVDILALAANSANTDVRQLGQALTFAAPTAAALGVSVEETIATIGRLSDAGIQSGLAGRGFQALVTGFINRRDEIQELIGDFDLQADGIADVVRRLNEAGITNAQVVQIFGAAQLDVFGVLTNATAEIDGQTSSLDQLAQSFLTADGTAARVATTMDDNLNGALLGARSRLEALIIALGDAGAETALIEAVQGLSGLLALAAENADILGIAIIGLSVRALGPLIVAAGQSAVVAFAAFQARLLAVQARIGAVGVAAFNLRAALALIGGPITIGIAAAAAAFVALGRSVEAANASSEDLASSLSRLRTVNQGLSDDQDRLELAYEGLSEAIETNGLAAQQAAATEITAINSRITANRALQAEYQRLVQAQARAAEARLANLEQQQLNDTGLRRDIPTLSRIEQDTGNFDRSRIETEEAFRRRQQAAVLARQEQINQALDEGRQITQSDLEFLSDIAAIEQERFALSQLQSQISDPNQTQAEFDLQQAITATIAERVEAQRLLAAAQERGIESAVDQAEQQLAIVERTLELLREGVSPSNARTLARAEFRADPETAASGGGGGNDGRTDAEIARQAELRRALEQRLEIDAAIRAGNDAKAEQLQEQVRVRALENDLIRAGVDADTARTRAITIARAEFQAAANERQEANQRALEEVNQELELNRARAAGDMDRVAAIEAAIETRRIENDLIRSGVSETEARTRAEQQANAVADASAMQRMEAQAAFLAQRDLELQLTIARAQGDERSVMALEQQLDIIARIEQLRQAGLSDEAARARAIAEVGAIAQAGQRAGTELAGAFASTISNNLFDAIEAGDFGGFLEGVIGDAARNGLEAGFAQLEDLLGQAFDAIFSGGIPGLGGQTQPAIIPAGIGTPATVDPATAQAAQANQQLGTAATGAAQALRELIFETQNTTLTLPDQASPGGSLLASPIDGTTPPIIDPATSEAAEMALAGIGQSATQAGTVLSGALALGATQSATANVTQATSSTATATTLTALATSATAAATALTQVAASGTGSSLFGSLPGLSFGGGRRRGGPVRPGQFYVVGEDGPEILIPDVAGSVVPNNAAFGQGNTVANNSGRPGEVVVSVVGATGNQEIQEMIMEGVRAGIRISRAEAGPAAAEFNSRRG